MIKGVEIPRVFKPKNWASEHRHFHTEEVPEKAETHLIVQSRFLCEINEVPECSLTIHTDSIHIRIANEIMVDEFLASDAPCEKCSARLTALLPEFRGTIMGKDLGIL